jgi:hypothetical protein
VVESVRIGRSHPLRTTFTATCLFRGAASKKNLGPTRDRALSPHSQRARSHCAPHKSGRGGFFRRVQSLHPRLRFTCTRARVQIVQVQQPECRDDTLSDVRDRHRSTERVRLWLPLWWRSDRESRATRLQPADRARRRSLHAFDRIEAPQNCCVQRRTARGGYSPPWFTLPDRCGRLAMQVCYPACCGLDVHKRGLSRV